MYVTEIDDCLEAEDKAPKRGKYFDAISLLKLRGAREAADLPVNLPGDAISISTVSLLRVVGLRGSGKSTVGARILEEAIAGSALREAEKTTVRSEAQSILARRRKAPPKAVALLEQFKDVPSVDPHLFRADMDRVLDPGF
jgi:hypothetical protein